MAKVTPTFYIFHGTDEFTCAEAVADLKRRLGPPEVLALNTTYLDGRKASLADLQHACDAIPFLAEKRLIIVEGLLTRLNARSDKHYLDALCGYLPRLPETTRLVFIEYEALPPTHPVLKLVEGGARGYVRQFNPPDSKELPGWIVKRVSKYGGKIEPGAAHQLAAVIGADLRLLDQEILKLVTYTNAARPITQKDVELLVPYVQAAVVFDLVDALGRRDGRAAANVLHRLLDAGEHPLGLLAMIARQFRLLLLVKELKAQGLSSRDAAQALNLHPFPTGKLYEQEVYFTAAQLESIHRHLLNIDLAVKSGEIEAEVALDLLVAGLAVQG
ncbi:MAG: DNA polymerase III subunit delta [Anaerolineae bacterium]|nr:DNA polymerase III subunit delta [Anaerolineae bacterium]